MCNWLFKFLGSHISKLSVIKVLQSSPIIHPRTQTCARTYLHIAAGMIVSPRDNGFTFTKCFLRREITLDICYAPLFWRQINHACFFGRSKNNIHMFLEGTSFAEEWLTIWFLSARQPCKSVSIISFLKTCVPFFRGKDSQIVKLKIDPKILQRPIIGTTC